MGPQLYRCGNAFIMTAGKQLIVRLQWGRNFIVAEITELTDYQHRFIKLQWGRNFIVAEIRDCRGTEPGALRASMGPQLYRCGNYVPTTQTYSWYVRLQWGRNFIVAEMLYSVLSKCQAPMLQWGRNFIVAEISTISARYAKVKHASMGPQLYRCGNHGAYGLPAPLYQASMGPQLYRCGNYVPTTQTYSWYVRLQWGRNFIVAEMLYSVLSKCQAPMLQWGRNFIVAEISTISARYAKVKHASMGPQLYRCGNYEVEISYPYYTPRFNGAATLSLRK